MSQDGAGDVFPSPLLTLLLLLLSFNLLGVLNALPPPISFPPPPLTAVPAVEFRAILPLTVIVLVW